MPRPFLKTRAKETRSTARPRQVQGQVDVPFMLLTVLLVVIGLIMLLSASYPSAYYDLKGNTGGDPFYYFKRQAVYALLGFGIMYLVSRLNFRRRNKNFLAILTQPNTTYIQRHTPGQVPNGLFVGPLLQKFSDTEQEHNGRRRIHIPPDERNTDRRRIQHRYLQLSPPQAVNTHTDIFH